MNSKFHFFVVTMGKQYPLSLLFIVCILMNTIFFGCTPAIFRYSSNGDLSSLKACIDEGEKVNQYDNKGESPLTNAILHGSPEVISFLIDRGADVNGKSSKATLSPLTPLMAAIKKQNLDVVKLLIEKGANVKGDHNSRTPLMVAAGVGNLEIFLFLESKGADIFAEYERVTTLREPSYVYRDPYTGQEIARTRDLDTSIGGTISMEWSEEEKRDSFTPLSIAADHGHRDIEEYIIEKLKMRIQEKQERESRERQERARQEELEKERQSTDSVSAVASQKCLSDTDCENNYACMNT